MRIDSHQHFWNYNPVDYSWIGPGLEILQRGFLPADLAPALRTAGIDGCVAVQASPTLAETAWLLNLSAANPWIRGVVGWADLCSPDVRAQLEHLSANPRFCGLRHVAPSEPGASFLLRSDFQRGIAVLEEFDLAFDILIDPRHLPAACELAAKFPHQRFIVDHLANPAIKERILSPWVEDLRCLAQFPNVACKVSGIVTLAGWQSWQSQEFTPYLDAVLAAFGPSRMMFGSDWPVCLLAASYQQAYELIAQYLEKLSSAEQASIWGETARNFYHI
jgi:L-fuconolactonase